MRERINRLARGIVENGVPELVLSPQEIRAAVPAGQTVSGEIVINSANNLHIKGLVYSGNERVKVLNHAFGGLRNRIQYEVNTHYCERGDEINGSFYLVTNGGEREIPYYLSVQVGNSHENLEQLETARDFANLARRDLELALRMFEYQEFVEAPFMQDVRVRTIYEGLKGRSGRRSLLEEFLVALHVKDPVSLTVNTKPQVFENVLEPEAGVIEIAVTGWGYVSAAVQTEGSFIRPETLTVTDRDFENGRYSLRFRILPEALHRGKNFGRIMITSMRQSFAIDIEAEGDVTVDITGRETEKDSQAERTGFWRYLTLRLDYETGMYEPALLINQMMKETDALRAEYPKDGRIRLIQAELMLMSGRSENGALILEESKDEILKNREKEAEFYCYYQYLALLIQPSDSQKESLIRYIKKILWEKKGVSPYLFLLLMKLDDTLIQNPLELYRSLEGLYTNGSSSPFVYGAACRLLCDHPELFTRMGDFELQVLYLGAKRNLLSKEIAVKAAGLMLGLKHYRKLAERLAVLMYGLYPEMELLEAVCSLLIKGDQRSLQAFSWYEKALGCHVNLTRLYEYFLYSLPDHYDRLLPKEVLLYFSYDKDLDNHSRSVLYKNILLYMNVSSELYQTYVRSMEQFAMEQLFASKINSRLAVLYEHMIYRDMIDERVAKVLPGILKSCRISCDDPRMKYVIVRYEELWEEEAYLLENGVAYVPLFSSGSVILFQDVYGNRYLDVKHRKVPVMGKSELLETCYEVYPDHPMLKLERCAKILEHGPEDNEQAELLEDVLMQMKLNPVFQKRILKAVTDYYCREAGAFHCTYLIQMEKEALDSRQRQQICEALISENYIREAYDMVKEYGSQYISDGKLMKLCTKTILQQLFDQDELLLHLAFCAFRSGSFDSVILDYLCEHFNGTVSQMYEVLIQGVQEHVETYDLEERLLGQMLFTGCCDRMDSVFDLYVNRKQTRESVVKAYFTQKCIRYFLEGEALDDRVFAYLDKAVKSESDKARTPTIYLLALTRYFSEQEELDGEDKALCREITDLLVEDGLVFPYTRELSRHVPVPEDILDKAMIEYRGRKDCYPELMVRILPEEEEFNTQDMRRVYQGIYVKEKVLFEGETMEYLIYDTVCGERRLAAQGKVQCDHKLKGRENSRFACLNRMGAALGTRDEKELFQAMEDYLKKSAALGALFPIE